DRRRGRALARLRPRLPLGAPLRAFGGRAAYGPGGPPTLPRTGRRGAAAARRAPLLETPAARAAHRPRRGRLPRVLPVDGARGLGAAELAPAAASRRRLAHPRARGGRGGARVPARRGRPCPRALPRPLHVRDRRPPRRGALRDARSRPLPRVPGP